MSRLIDELTRTDRAAFQPMGFRTSREAQGEPRLRLIGVAGFESYTADCFDGADAMLFKTEKSVPAEKTIKSAITSVGEIPWGIYVPGISAGKLSTIIKDGCDFLVFPAAAAISDLPEDDATGKIIEVESSLDDGLIRAINNLTIDAVMVTDSLEKDGPLVWQQLMIFQHILNLLTKPVIVPVSLNMSESELKTLWETGIDGVIVEFDKQQPAGFGELRGLINKLPPRTSKKGKTDAILPSPGVARESEPEEEEEEWE
jgi:hypothetical protein